MNRRGTGALLILVGALLHGARFLSAAIFGSGVASWNRDLFRAMLQYVGPELAVAGYVAVGVGILYMVWGETAGD